MALKYVRLQAINRHIGNSTCFYALRTTSSSRQKAQSHQAVFIEKSLEVPVLVVAENDNVDIIGPPDPVSNLRPILRKRLLSETVLQQQLRELQDATQLWNHEFWSEHNTRFRQKRQEYINKYQIEGEEKRQLSADEMSEFYKEFLDTNWRTHVDYNWEWYKRNFQLLLLAFKANLERSVFKLRHRGR